MTPVQTAATDTVVIWPNDPDRQDDDMFVRVEGDTTYSYWRPNPIELLKLMRGQPIRIGVCGPLHPHISVDTEE